MDHVVELPIQEGLPEVSCTSVVCNFETSTSQPCEGNMLIISSGRLKIIRISRNNFIFATDQIMHCALSSYI
jgi:hypothetical protein